MLLLDTVDELLLEFDQLTANNDTLLGTNGGSNATTNETGFEENAPLLMIDSKT